MKLLNPLLLVLFLFPSVVSAFNHSEIDWQSVSTKNFILHYYDRTEPAVYATWKIVEEAYDSLRTIFDYEPKNKIHIALADYDDYSNGWAAWLEDNIMIWVPDARMDLRGNTAWLRNVLIHELTHIMSMGLRNDKKIIDWSISLNGAYNGPQGSVAGGYILPIPRITTYPNWITEGISQLGSSYFGGDCWDSRRDMILRCAVLDTTMLSLDEMANFSHDNLGNEMVYNHGFSFVKYLADIAGKESIHRLFNQGGKERHRFFALFEQSLKIPLERAYNNWVRTITHEYQTMLPPAPTKTQALWSKGTQNHTPRLSPDERFMVFLSNDKSDANQSDLLITSVSSGKIIKRIKDAHTDWDFSADGKSIFYIKSRWPNKNGSYFNDLFQYFFDSGKIKRITHNARVYDVSASPDGKHLAITAYKNSQFSLKEISLTSGKSRTLVDGEIGHPFKRVCYSPADPGKLVFGRIIEGISHIFALDLSDNTTTPLLRSRAQEEDPYWGKDNRIYFSADYEQIFNVYSILPDGSDLRRHSAMTGGAFEPSLSPSGKLIISEYTSQGFKISSLPANAVPYRVPDTYHCSLRGIPKPTGKVRIRSKEYEDDYLNSTWYMATFADISYGSQRERDSAAITLGHAMLRVKNDALNQKHSILTLAGGIPYFYQDTSSTRGSYVNSMSRLNAIQFYSLAGQKNNTFATSTKLTNQTYSEFITQSNAQLTRTIAGANATDGDSAEQIALPEFIINPALNLESNAHKVTLGLYGEALTIRLLPVQIALNPYLVHHAADPLYWGISPVFFIMPFAGEFFLTGNITLWAQAFSYGYINEDINYNNRNVFSAAIAATPAVNAYSRIENSYDFSSDTLISDTSYAAFTGITFQAQLSYGIPLFAYSTIEMRTEGALTVMDVSLSDPRSELSGYSDAYTNAGGVCTIHFPIARNINRGHALFAENIYGRLFNTISFYGNRRFLNNGNFSKSDDVNLRYSLGFGLTLGTIKKYVYHRMMSFDASWDVMNDLFELSLTYQ